MRHLVREVSVTVGPSTSVGNMNLGQI